MCELQILCKPLAYVKSCSTDQKSSHRSGGGGITQNIKAEEFWKSTGIHKSSLYRPTIRGSWHFPLSFILHAWPSTLSFSPQRGHSKHVHINMHNPLYPTYIKGKTVWNSRFHITGTGKLRSQLSPHSSSNSKHSQQVLYTNSLLVTDVVQIQTILTLLHSHWQQPAAGRLTARLHTSCSRQHMLTGFPSHANTMLPPQPDQSF